MELLTDESSFQCVTCAGGQGNIEGMEIEQGDGFFIPANYGKYSLSGEMKIIVTKV